QAEDGIRDFHVTGVQTCALPIYRGNDWEILGPDMTRQSRWSPEPQPAHTSYGSLHSVAESRLDPGVLWTGSGDGLICTTEDRGQIGRASCRERVEMSVSAAALKK